MRHGTTAAPRPGIARALGIIQWCHLWCLFMPGAVALAALAPAPATAGGEAAEAGAGPTAAGMPLAAARDSVAAPVRLLAQVVADTLHLTVDLPAREMAAAGALLDRNADGQIDAAELAASRDTLASYLEHHVYIIQDDGMLSPRLVGPVDSMPGATAGAPRVRCAMRAPLLNTYERIGFASGILTNRIVGYRAIVAVNWKGASAEFDVAQSIQWVEPPGDGATRLELPGRQPAAEGSSR